MAQDNDLLNVRVKSGTFYLSSKEEKEGWEKNQFTNPQNKDETLTRWHKKINVEGKIQYLAIKDDKYRGKVLSMIIQGEDESYSITLPIYSTGGSVKTTNEYFNSVVGSLQNVSKGDKIKMFVNSKNEDKSGRLYRQIVILDENDNLIKAPYAFSEIPKWEKVEKDDGLGGVEVEWNAEPANVFFKQQAKKAVDEFGNGSSTSTPKQEESTQETSKNESQSNTETPTDTAADEYDDLPF